MNTLPLNCIIFEATVQFQYNFTATEDIALCFYVSSVVFLLICILYSMQNNVSEMFFFFIPSLSFPDMWPKKLASLNELNIQ